MPRPDAPSPGPFLTAALALALPAAAGLHRAFPEVPLMGAVAAGFLIGWSGARACFRLLRPPLARRGPHRVLPRRPWSPALWACLGLSAVVGGLLALRWIGLTALLGSLGGLGLVVQSALRSRDALWGARLELVGRSLELSPREGPAQRLALAEVQQAWRRSDGSLRLQGAGMDLLLLGPEGGGDYEIEGLPELSSALEREVSFTPVQSLIFGPARPAAGR
jgi:hypothetical protein